MHHDLDGDPITGLAGSRWTAPIVIHNLPRLGDEPAATALLPSYFDLKK